MPRRAPTHRTCVDAESDLERTSSSSSSTASPTNRDLQETRDDTARLNAFTLLALLGLLDDNRYNPLGSMARLVTASW